MYNRAKLLSLYLIVILAGCRSNGHREDKLRSSELQPESAHASSNRPAASPNAVSLKFAPPAGWISETPASSSRRAQYKLPHVAGDPEDAEMVVFYFQGGGGTPQANVERWIAQFQTADRKSRRSNTHVKHRIIHGLPATTLDVKGTYDNSTMISTQGQTSPKEHFRMLAAVIETAAGPWFFKLTGPEKTVEKWRPSFEQFLDSVEQK
jgi:hypothetical protein